MDNKSNSGWIAIHEEVEIAKFRLNIDADSVLNR